MTEDQEQRAREYGAMRARIASGLDRTQRLYRYQVYAQTCRALRGNDIGANDAAEAARDLRQIWYALGGSEETLHATAREAAESAARDHAEEERRAA